MFLVRHGDAGSKEDWTGDDRLRPLSRRGVADAEALAEVIARFEPVRIVSSPLLRCRQTVEPLARRLGLDVEESECLTPDAGHAAAELVRALAGGPGPVVVSTHGETIEALQQDLEDASVGFGPERARDKGSLWVLEVRRGRLTSARYLPPPRLSPGRTPARQAAGPTR